MDRIATDSMNLGHYAKAIGHALDVACPRCGSDANEKCVNVIPASEGGIFPLGIITSPHVERARIDRWAKMLDL